MQLQIAAVSGTLLTIGERHSQMLHQCLKMPSGEGGARAL